MADPLALEVVKSFVIPIGTLVVSLSFTLWITNANRLEQRREQQRQRDQHFVDNFLRETEGFYGVTFTDGPVTERTLALTSLRGSFRRLASFASGSARGELEHEMNEHYNLIHSALMTAMMHDADFREEQLNGYSSEWNTDDARKVTEVLTADRAIDDMRSLARDWPDLTRRRLILRRISARAISQWPEPPTDVKLAIDRHLLVSMPSRSRIRRVLDRLNVERRRLVDDWRYHRLGQRLEEAWFGLREDYLQRRSMRQMFRAAKQQRREERYVRRMYELA